MTTPRAILWDADGVLQRIPTETWPLAVAIVSQVHDALTGADIDERLIRSLTHASGLDDHIDEILSVWWSFDIDDAVLDLVSKIKKQGIRCYLATNQDAYRAACMRTRTPYEQMFDGAYYSCDMGVAKPATGFFKGIVSDLAIPAQDVLFIDDQAANVAGARAAGLNAEQWTHSDGVERLAHLLGDHGVTLQDVMVDRETKRAHRRQALDGLTAEASEAGLYERTAEEYQEALEQARREIQRENQ